MNMSSVQMPVPVFWSGVRLAAKDTPQGPANAVPLAAAVIIQRSEAATGAEVTANALGWPESIRAMSGSGPLGPILSGVWQSLQPPTVTRYLPRSAWRLPLAADVTHAAAATASSATAPS